MGKEIVYCHACGSRLREEDFSRGRAHIVDFQSFCAQCRPDLTVAPPPPPVPSPRKERVAPKKPATSVPVPAVRRASPTPPRRRWIVAGSAIATVILLAAILLLGRSSPTPPPPPESAASRSEAPSDLGPMVKLLEDLQTTSSDPDRVLKRCDELAPLVKGTPYEGKVKEIRRRAQDSGFVVDPGRRIDLALAEAKKLEDLDPRFERRSEVKSLLEKARDSAGPRRSEIDQALAFYDKKFDDAARAAQDRAKEEAERLATGSRFREAADRLTEYPPSFRGTRYGESLAALREDYLRRTSELERQVSDRVMGPWKDWKIADCMGSPVFIEAADGRSHILQTHPASPEVPASLERTLDVPKGQNLLSFWVSYLKDGDWELRVVIDGKRVMADTIGGFEPRWKEVQVDLAPYQGRQIALRLENAANGWYWEQGLWNDLSIRPGTPDQWAARRKREMEIWSPWKVSSSPGAGMPVYLDSHDGRLHVLRTHPFAKDKPALLEREIAIPPGKKADFAVCVNHLRAAEWELRIVAGDTVLLRDTLSGSPGWKKVSVDLSPYAGKKVSLRLENGAVNWNHDYAYFSDPELQIR